MLLRCLVLPLKNLILDDEPLATTTRFSGGCTPRVAFMLHLGIDGKYGSKI